MKGLDKNNPVYNKWMISTDVEIIMFKINRLHVYHLHKGVNSYRYMYHIVGEKKNKESGEGGAYAHIVTCQ